jgi:hypothetical protein
LNSHSLALIRGLTLTAAAVVFYQTELKILGQIP